MSPTNIPNARSEILVAAFDQYAELMKEAKRKSRRQATLIIDAYGLCRCWVLCKIFTKFHCRFRYDSRSVPS